MVNILGDLDFTPAHSSELVCLVLTQCKALGSATGFKHSIPVVTLAHFQDGKTKVWRDKTTCCLHQASEEGTWTLVHLVPDGWFGWLVRPNAFSTDIYRS